MLKLCLLLCLVLVQPSALRRSSSSSSSSSSRSPSSSSSSRLPRPVLPSLPHLSKPSKRPTSIKRKKKKKKKKKKNGSDEDNEEETYFYTPKKAIVKIGNDGADGISAKLQVGIIFS